MKNQILLSIFIFSQLFVFTVDSKEIDIKSSKKTTTQDKNPSTAALLGWIPGLGQAYIGNYGTAGFQAATFLGLSSLRRNYYSRPDYIEYESRDVKFNWTEVIIGHEFEKYGNTYLDYPLFTETGYSRLVRLAKQGKLAEENPIIKYKEYQRTSRSSFYSDQLSNPILSTMMYSVYSSYRDAGGLGELAKQETIGELIEAPFSLQILKDPKVFLPIAAIMLLAPLSTMQDSVILAPKSLIRDGSLYGGAFITGMSPAIGEEAFFRGYLNYTMMKSMGPWLGGGLSGIAFGAAHIGNPGEANAIASFLPRALMGFYFSYLHYQSNYDIKPGIALHFWWNFIISISMIRNYKPDPLFNKSQQEVHLMPLVFEYKF